MSKLSIYNKLLSLDKHRPKTKYVMKFYPKLSRAILAKFGKITASAITEFLVGRPKCKTCGGKTPFLWFAKGFQKSCSTKCMSSQETVEKRKATNQKLYGGPTPLFSESCKKKAIATSIRNYGIANPRQSKAVKEKVRKTCLRRYGVENPSSHPAFMEKRKQNYLKKHGVCAPAQIPEIKRKQEETHFRKTGFYFSMQDPQSKRRHTETLYKNYGVTHPSKSAEITHRIQKSSFRVKHFRLHGYDFDCQGYEPQVIKFLVKKVGINPAYILSSFKEVKSISTDSGQTYHPDIKICKTKLLIEVKSTWTVGLKYSPKWKGTKKAFTAANDNGYKLLLIIPNQAGRIVSYVFNTPSKNVIKTRLLNSSDAVEKELIKKLKINLPAFVFCP